MTLEPGNVSSALLADTDRACQHPPLPLDYRCVLFLAMMSMHLCWICRESVRFRVKSKNLEMDAAFSDPSINSSLTSSSPFSQTWNASLQGKKKTWVAASECEIKKKKTYRLISLWDHQPSFCDFASIECTMLEHDKSRTNVQFSRDGGAIW